MCAILHNTSVSRVGHHWKKITSTKNHNVLVCSLKCQLIHVFVLSKIHKMVMLDHKHFISKQIIIRNIKHWNTEDSVKHICKMNFSWWFSKFENKLRFLISKYYKTPKLLEFHAVGVKKTVACQILVNYFLRKIT